MRTAGSPLPVRAVLFDLDDTLFDHSACTRQALRALQAAFPILATWSFEDLEQRHAALLEALHVEVLGGRMTIDEARLKRFGRLASDAGHEAAEAHAPRIARAYREAYRSSWRTVPGARELLSTLHGRVGLGIVTNNVVVEQRQKIDACGFASLVDAVVISEERGIAKPDPRIFHECLSQLGVDAAEAVMVGDSWPSDIVGARAAGLHAVWFNRTGAAVPDGSDIAQLESLEPTEAAVRCILTPHKRVVPRPLSPDP